MRCSLVAPVVALLALVLSGCPRSTSQPAGESAAAPDNTPRQAEPLSFSTGLFKRPVVNTECPDISAAMKPKGQPPHPALAQGIHGGEGLSAEDLTFMDNARNCNAGDSCVSVDEPCNCSFSINARMADKFVETIRGRVKCAQAPCCAWGGNKGSATCKNGRCVFIDAEADAISAALGGGPPPACPDRQAERDKAKEKREVAGMAGIRGGAGLTASDVLVLKNSSACNDGDTCVRVADPCNCGFTVNQHKEASVREVAARLKCDKAPCCKWKGKPVCRSGECQDTY